MEQRATADTVVLIHGLWMTPLSWEHWVTRYEQRGLNVITPGYPGIELVLPDLAFIEDQLDNLVGIVITHGHEDHIGAIPYLAADLGVPLYATRFTAGASASPTSRTRTTRRRLDQCASTWVRTSRRAPPSTTVPTIASPTRRSAIGTDPPSARRTGVEPTVQ